MSSEKTIDGLSTRRVTTSGAVPIKRRIPTKSGVKNVRVSDGRPIAPAAKPTPKTPAKQVKSTRSDFLKPVESFDFDFNEKELKKQSRKSKKTKEKKKPSKARKIITGILLFIVLAIIAGVVWVLIWGNDLISKLTGGNSSIWDAISTLTSDTYVDLKTASNGRTNILIFGTSGYDMSGAVGKGHHDGSQLTDSIMAVSIDQTTGDVAMTSIPRDLKVTGACYAGKINEVFLCNNKKGDAEGATALMNTVSEVLGIDFQYYVHINWGSLVQIVDSLGGITVTLDEDINDKNYTGAVFKAGQPYTINGEQALGLARARHGTVGGDFTRGTSQQKILIAIKDRIMEKMNGGNFGLTDAIGLVSVLGDNLRTNISIEEIKTTIHLLESLDLHQMRQVMVYNYNDRSQSYMKTANINGLSYVIPNAGEKNYTKIHEMIAKEFSSDAVAREAAPILVLNGSAASGSAATEAKALEADGFKIADYSNAPTSEYTDRYYLYLLDDSAYGTANILKGRFNTAVRPASELPADIKAGNAKIVVILGKS